jgi:hypothetical protein
VVQRLDQMDQRQREDAQILHTKLDGVASVGHRVNSVESVAETLKSRLDDIDGRQADHAVQLARTQGRNDVLIGVMSWVGGPVVAALTIAGISKLFNVDLGL